MSIVMAINPITGGFAQKVISGFACEADD